jgi:hypothetical protein
MRTGSGFTRVQCERLVSAIQLIKCQSVSCGAVELSANLDLVSGTIVLFVFNYTCSKVARLKVLIGRTYRVSSKNFGLKQ